MSRRVGTTLAVLAIAANAAMAAHAASGLPEWASAAAAEPTDTLRAPGVELLNEKQRTVGPDGRSSTVVHRRVMRVLRADGRSRAVDVVVYQSDTDKIREGRAWSVAPDGTVRSHGMKEAADRELAEDALYSDARIRSFDLTRRSWPEARARSSGWWTNGRRSCRTSGDSATSGRCGGRATS